VTTLPNDAANKETAVDNFGAFRVSLDTGRKQLQQKLAGAERVPDEMGLKELARYAVQKGGREGRDALILWHRRLALSFAPFFLALLGASLSLKFGRGGRGWGTLLSLLTLVFYYLLSLLGEQTARAGTLPPFVGGWIATLSVALLGLWWLRRADRRSGKRFRLPRFSFNFQAGAKTGKTLWFKSPKSYFDNFETGIFGLLERDVLRSILWYFFLTCSALLLLFHVFTVFEVLRALTAAENGLSLVLRYLLFLSPTVLWQVAPTALMIAVLITYTLKARNRETVVWGAAGQSVYVLLFPCLILAAVVGWVNWEWQERLLPLTNPRQDVLRAQLRGVGSVGSQEGRFWVSSVEGIYSFTGKRASDNAVARDIAFYEFNSDQTHLNKIVYSTEGSWAGEGVSISGQVRQIIWQKSYIEIREAANDRINIDTSENPFNQIVVKTIDINSEALENLIKTSESESEERRLSVALYRKYSTLFLPLVIIFFTVPIVFAMRKLGGAGKALGTALALWLLFLGATAIFERLGTEGILPPQVSVWSPLILFSSLGWYLLAKMRH
jgi:lipopolysaccharide export LptBFGC system permease protein LptF